MSDAPEAAAIDYADDLDARLRRDGVTLDAEDREYLLTLLPYLAEWSTRIRLAETRYAEPATIHVVKP